MTSPVLVFDLDGTLIDTAHDLLDSVNHCLDHVGLNPVDPASLHRFVGHGGRIMIQRALRSHGHPGSDTDVDELLPLFMQHYSTNMPGKSLPYPGALDAVDRFAKAGFRIAICTNKLQLLSDTLIKGLGLSDRFAAICGADRFAFRKPDRRHLTETINAAGGIQDGSIMVGDSKTDIDTAKAAGLPVVAVDWGYTDTHVSNLGPDVVISHFDELTLELAERLVKAS